LTTFWKRKNGLNPKNKKHMDDLSIKSWASTDELMTETLAKVFVKQKNLKCTSSLSNFEFEISRKK